MVVYAGGFVELAALGLGVQSTSRAYIQFSFCPSLLLSLSLSLYPSPLSCQRSSRSSLSLPSTRSSLLLIRCDSTSCRPGPVPPFAFCFLPFARFLPTYREYALDGPRGLESPRTVSV